jgi:uncharacterized FAD-dependent dehydrogenase
MFIATQEGKVNARFQFYSKLVLFHYCSLYIGRLYLQAKKYKANTSKSDTILGGRQNIFQTLQDLRNETREKVKNMPLLLYMILYSLSNEL